ncbi:DUF6891 domain-containing protein [Nonomuraea sp. SBT364]|uniref:DUF6891 domain-containing protein n=1 Tax=Nonomuraea sp. SBT364 TaxID=1580530 RepID=UPI000ACB6D4A|nr:hypothetical protein [Nonomuraea sp. SBT364]
MIDGAEILRSAQAEVAVGAGSYGQVVQVPEERWGIHEGVAELVDGEFARQLAEQEEWPEVTDCDRLTAAFRDLDVAGVKGREQHQPR